MMRSVLAFFLWFAGTLWIGCAWAQDNYAASGFLTVAQTGDPQFVVDWLKRNGTVVDRTEADRYFEVGNRENQKKNWSATTKAFGESMIRYPSPQALVAYAEAELRMLGEIRSRDRSFDQNKLPDLSEALHYTRSAMAADGVLGAMSKAEQSKAQLNADCLAAYIQSGKIQGICPLLEAYGLMR
jgi:hypothetical protein